MVMEIKKVLPFQVPSIKKINSHPKKYKSISFFAGCGGSSTGMKMAGFNVLYANEFVDIAADTYAANAPDTIVDRTDIREIDFKALMKKLGLKEGQLDHMDGSPPCSSFSTAGTREDGWGEEKSYSEGKVQRTDDLFFQFTRALRAFRPKTFDAENVSGLIKGAAKGYFLAIIRDLEACGYVVKAQLLDASWLGIPQARQRIIFVGVRKDIHDALGLNPVFPTPLSRQVTVRECLPHVAMIKTKVQSVIKYVDSNRPNSTITASDSLTSPTAKFSDGGYIETFDGEQRKYNIDELKVICGFPKDFKLLGKYEQQFERLGRSHVPVQMYWVCKAISEQILDKIPAKFKYVPFEMPKPKKTKAKSKAKTKEKK